MGVIINVSPIEHGIKSGALLYHDTVMYRYGLKHEK
jgi:hypothetical protein